MKTLLACMLTALNLAFTPPAQAGSCPAGTVDKCPNHAGGVEGPCQCVKPTPPSGGGGAGGHIKAFDGATGAELAGCKRKVCEELGGGLPPKCRCADNNLSSGVQGTEAGPAGSNTGYDLKDNKKK